MKLWLLSFLFINIAYSGLSQNDFSFSIDTAMVYGDADEEELTALSMISNHTNSTLIFGWERITNNLSTDWESYICSNITCAPPDVSWGTFSLTANDSTNLDCHFILNDNPGIGTVKLRIFVLADTSQVANVTYIADATPVSTSQPLLDKIEVFPNPAFDFITINSNQHQYIEMFDYTGKVVKQGGQESTIPINDLSNGFYVLRIYESESKLLSINKIHIFSPR